MMPVSWKYAKPYSQSEDRKIIEMLEPRRKRIARLAKRLGRTEGAVVTRYARLRAQGKGTG